MSRAAAPTTIRTLYFRREHDISITDDRTLSQHESHFQTVRTLADYVMQLMREEADG